MNKLTISELVSLRRLLHDLKEVISQPLPDVCALPSQSNLYEWHGNVRSSEECLAGVPIHFVLIFPKTYPAQPPECRLFTPIPHPNVMPAIKLLPGLREARWRLALFDCVPTHSTWSCAYSVQSILAQLQAFLLHEDLQYDTAKISVEEATAQARRFCCPSCAHQGAACPFPAFPSGWRGQEPYRPNKSSVGQGISFTSARHRRGAAALRRHQQSSYPKVKVAAPISSTQSASPTATPSPVDPHAPPSNPLPGTPTLPTSPAPHPDDSWIEVRKKKTGPPAAVNQQQLSTNTKGKAPGTKGNIQHSSTDTKKTSQSLNPSPDQEEVLVSPSSFKPLGPSTSAVKVTNVYGALLTKEAKKMIKDMDKAHCSFSQVASPDTEPSAGPVSTPAAPSTLSKAAKKNLSRSLKRKAKQQQNPSSSSAAAAVAGPPVPFSTPSTGAEINTACSSHIPPCATGQPPLPPPSPGLSTLVPGAKDLLQVDQGGTSEELWQPVKGKNHKDRSQPGSTSHLMEQLGLLNTRPHQELIQEVVEEVEATARVGGAGGCVDIMAPSIEGDSGLFGLLPRDILLQIMLMVGPRDLASLSQTSRGLMHACRDGQLWLSLLRRHYPASRLSGSSITDWRHAFILEAASVPDDLQCFYSKMPLEEDVLGLPLRYTLNPVTGRMDYIEVDVDLMAITMFKAGVRHTPNREHIDALLPVYLTQEHFIRAMPHLEALMRKLAPAATTTQTRSGVPGPDTWLDILPTMMKTAVVLLSDRGMSASQRALTMYCQLHRLLLALCEHYNLWGSVAARIDHFLSSPKHRTKSSCPDLGLLYPLLSLSPAHEWSQVAAALVTESFHRAVLWMCKCDLSLVEQFQQPLQHWTDPAGRKLPVPDPIFLSSTLKASTISRRLMMFHVAFLRLVACPLGSSLEQVMDSYDALFGRPGAGLTSRFQQRVQHILEVDSWQDFFQLAGLKCPDEGTLTAMLKRCWVESLRKGYHSLNTNFAAIHRSGVSKILLKGESYSTPPGIKIITMEERWRWRQQHGVKYLDASCLLFNVQGQLLEAVDYNHRSSYTTQQQGAVAHSGDILDLDACSGLHTLTINLGALGPRVSHIFITMSSFSGAMLNEIEQPFVSVRDPDTGMDLCGYHLEDQGLDCRQQHSSVIMCRVTREQGAGGQWRIHAIGQLAQGYAGVYGPIVDRVTKML